MGLRTSSAARNASNLKLARHLHLPAGLEMFEKSLAKHVLEEVGALMPQPKFEDLARTMFQGQGKIDRSVDYELMYAPVLSEILPQLVGTSEYLQQAPLDDAEKTLKLEIRPEEDNRYEFNISYDGIMGSALRATYDPETEQIKVENPQNIPDLARGVYQGVLRYLQVLS
jgi:hypothetical protein